MDALLTTSKGPITIRHAGPDDAAALRELRLEGLAAHPEAFARDYASAAAESVESWTERIAEYAAENVGVIHVASAGQELIALAGLFRENGPKLRHFGTIWGVYVKPEWRGLHLAEALVHECFGWAASHGVVVVKLGVVTTNTPAIRCYARCGFTVYGIDPKAIYYNGVYYDELLMSRAI